MENIDINALPPCGYTCSDCHHDCPGCRQTCGKPFWISEYNWSACPIYDCCCNNKHLEHCGSCSELPCKIFLTLRDPDMTDEDFEASLNSRINILKKRNLD